MLSAPKKKAYQNYLPEILKDIDLNKAKSEENKKKLIKKILKDNEKTKIEKLEEINVYISILES